MKTALRALIATSALAAAVALSAPASAAVSVSLTNSGDPFGLPAGQTLVADFDDAADQDATLVPWATLTLNGATVGFNEGGSGYSGTLPNDSTHYLTVPGGKSATFDFSKLLTSFSLFMGSPDTYNQIEFFGANGFHAVLNGTDMFNGDTNQSWSWGKRVNFGFGDDRVNKVVLASGSNSFEVDNAAAGAVPEPATWMLMIMGFGTAGALLRRRRMAAALA